MQQSAPGRIAWGVRDSDAEVLGVALSRADRDELRRLITEKLHKITPTLAPTSYRVDLQPLCRSAQSNAELWLVEVGVPPSGESIL